MSEFLFDLKKHGHGHVVPRDDGEKVFCEGIGMCQECIREQEIFRLWVLVKESRENKQKQTLTRGHLLLASLVNRHNVSFESVVKLVGIIDDYKQLDLICVLFDEGVKQRDVLAFACQLKQGGFVLSKKVKSPEHQNCRCTLKDGG